ncbi:unnamed protein product [Rhizophagus irregularis]|nr:unnamed protein product [Rhizophagus irregularis]
MHFRFKFCKLFAKNPFYWSININVVQNQRLTNQTYSPIVNCERIHQRFLPHKPYLSHQPHPFLESSKSGSLPSGGNEKLLSQNNDHEFASKTESVHIKNLSEPVGTESTKPNRNEPTRTAQPRTLISESYLNRMAFI